ncbi:MAG: glutaredoxin family protein [Pseudomonadota bacterium]
MPELTLFHRPDCHLCQAMQVALDQLRGEVEFDLKLVDVDRDPELELRYGFYVPVLELAGKTLCYYHFNREKVVAALEAQV